MSLEELNRSPGGVTVDTRNLNPPLHWDLTIAAHARLWSLPMRELWRYRDLLVLLVRRDFVSFYKQTILGPAWFFVQPLLTALMFYVVFGRIAQLPTDGAPKILFYLTGITFWNYFSECFTKTSETFIANTQLFSKVYFPRLIIPLSIVLSNLLRFAIQLSLLIFVWLWYFTQGDIRPNLAMLLFPLIVIAMATIGMGVGLIFSAATTKYRDLRFLIQFGVQLLMYATPIIYPLSIAEGRWRSWINVNPLAPLFEAIRYGWLGTGEVSIRGLIWTTLFAVASFVLGLLLFNHTERNFIDTV